MLHWSASQLGEPFDDGHAPEDETPLAQRIVTRMISHLGDTIRHFQRHASLRATAFGWEPPAAGADERAWTPCPRCQSANMNRVNAPVPQDVFECPSCHAVVTDARAVTYPLGPPVAPPVDLSSLDYDPWIIDDPRR